MLTAGFWSKDEIFAEAFGNGHLVVFIVLALAAFLTAFYTMRQITLTFFGEAAHQGCRTCQRDTLDDDPAAGRAGGLRGRVWLGGHSGMVHRLGWIPDWFHEFVGGTLAQAPEAVPFNWIPLATSLVVALGGLFCGWLVYRKVSVPGGRPAANPVAQE